MKYKYFRFLSYWLIAIVVGIDVGQAQTLEHTQKKPADVVWYEQTNSGDINIHLYFFWSKKCPHCQEALPFVRSLPTKHHWLRVHSLELTEHPNHFEQYINMAAMLGQQARSVPAFLWCGQMTVGYDNEHGMGQFLLEQLSACRQQLAAQNNMSIADVQSRAVDPVITLPVLGNLDFKQFSLPTFTVILAGMDAFNPCAFFVLLFLLSLLVHAKNRRKILLVGGIFVFFSGLLYFLFMAAWLNIFLLIGQINAITYAAGSLAVIFALINIKDYFWFKQGVSLSIPDSAKPGLFARMRRIFPVPVFLRRFAAPRLLFIFGITNSFGGIPHPSWSRPESLPPGEAPQGLRVILRSLLLGP